MATWTRDLRQAGLYIRLKVWVPDRRVFMAESPSPVRVSTATVTNQQSVLQFSPTNLSNRIAYSVSLPHRVNSTSSGMLAERMDRIFQIPVCVTKIISDFKLTATMFKLHLIDCPHAATSCYECMHNSLVLHKDFVMNWYIQSIQFEGLVADSAIMNLSLRHLLINTNITRPIQALNCVVHQHNILIATVCLFFYNISNKLNMTQLAQKNED
jgi:hypothetical protein